MTHTSTYQQYFLCDTCGKFHQIIITLHWDKESSPQTVSYFRITKSTIRQPVMSLGYVVLQVASAPCLIMQIPQRRPIRKMPNPLFSCFCSGSRLSFDEERRPLLGGPWNGTRWDRRWGPRGRGSFRRKRYIELPSPALKRLENPGQGRSIVLAVTSFISSVQASSHKPAK